MVPPPPSSAGGKAGAGPGPVAAMPAEPEKPATELDLLKMRADAVTDDSLEATRRMLALCDESKEAGIRTLVGLDEQGEQLDKIDEDMDKINVDMREAEKNLTGMEGCCGICPCGKAKEFKEDAGTWKSSEDGKVISGQPARVVDDRNGAGPMSSAYIAKITKDAREDEMEDNMGQVSTMIGNLRNMAIDMGSEISNQNSQLDRINQKTASNETRIATANQRATKLLH
uniref:Synaptosomal-associated protein n=1 Tax=Aceria tosichella TaxID=561515 RepID=A0A6G1SG83_9ACAR